MRALSTRLPHLAALALAMILGAGCAAPAEPESADDRSAITQVPSTPVENQAIGNCWLYATGAWAESLHLAATGQAFDISQSYWSYWDWYDQISSPGAIDGVSTGGTFVMARILASRYGLIAANDFVPDDIIGDRSQRQADAAVAINASLATGALSSPAARKDRKLVRAELDRAWRLPETTTRLLDQVFGDDVGRRFDTPGKLASREGTPILTTADFEVQYSKAPGTEAKRGTLATAFTEWKDALYGSGDHRAFQIRVQKALHDRMPVVISWFVDMNALDRDPNSPTRGTFTKETLARSTGKSVRGWHLTVIVDYQVKTTKFGVLEAGTPLDPSKPDDKQKLEAALQRDSVVELFRIKNSWGTSRADRPSVPSAPGDFDLAMSYLDGPVSTCDDPDVSRCFNKVPLGWVVLPPGY